MQAIRSRRENEMWYWLTEVMQLVLCLVLSSRLTLKDRVKDLTAFGSLI